MLVALLGILGLVLGSFANVVIFRVPRGQSIVRPGSRCPGCGAAVRARDNVPLISWLALRGRCRGCRMSISARYPAVELLTGAVFALYATRVARETDLVAFLPFAWVLVVLTFIDLEHKLLPNRIVLPATAAAVVLFGVAAMLGPGLDAWTRALAGGAIAIAVFFTLALIAPAGMGMGDVKLSALLGMALGYPGGRWGERVFVGFFVAFVAGALVGIGLMIARRGGMKTQVPFGPFLALGATIGVLWGDSLVSIWLPR